jgi:hypothetical protein
MANIFPEIEPDICRRSWRGFEKMIEAADGSPQFNVPHAHLQALFHLEWGSTLPIADRKTIVDHWKAARASVFTFFDFTTANGFAKVAIGTGNGAQTVFTLPAKSVAAAGLSVWIEATPWASYTLGAGTGAEGEDQITFASPPAVADVLYAAATTARRRHYGYWLTRQVDEEHVEADIWRLVLDFAEKVPPT